MLLSLFLFVLCSLIYNREVVGGIIDHFSAFYRISNKKMLFH